VRRDPMAMLPFCGYHMADYWQHWLDVGDRSGAGKDGYGAMPRVFYVNWFRKDENGRFLWPGFGENSRVLEWVFRRCNGDAPAVRSPIGLLPSDDALNTQGLDVAPEAMAKLLHIDVDEWKREAASIR